MLEIKLSIKKKYKGKLWNLVKWRYKYRINGGKLTKTGIIYLSRGGLFGLK